MISLSLTKIVTQTELSTDVPVEQSLTIQWMNEWIEYNFENSLYDDFQASTTIIIWIMGGSTTEISSPIGRLYFLLLCQQCNANNQLGRFHIYYIRHFGVLRVNNIFRHVVSIFKRWHTRFKNKGDEIAFCWLTSLRNKLKHCDSVLCLYRAII